MGVLGQAKGWMTDKLGDSEEELRVQVRCRAGRGRWGELQVLGPWPGPALPSLTVLHRLGNSGTFRPCTGV